jgi:hypothetical protein
VSGTHDVTPLFCPVCESAMTSKDDDLYFDLLACCKECGMKWAETRRASWLNGWRPDQQEINNEILRRRSHILNGIDIKRG